MKAFALSDTQEIELQKWQDKIKELFGEFGHYDYVFTPFGMGTKIKVISHLTKTEIDLSDVENW